MRFSNRIISRMRSASRIFLFRSGRKRTLPGDGFGALRTLQVSLPGSLFGDARYIHPSRLAEVEAFAPEIILGGVRELSVLARAVLDGKLHLPSFQRAIFVLTAFRDAPFSPSERDLLWKAWGVPVFELLLDSAGFAIAAECAAHDGHHAVSGAAFTIDQGQIWCRVGRERAFGTGLEGELDLDACACGAVAPRIRNARLDLSDSLRLRLLAAAS